MTYSKGLVVIRDRTIRTLVIQDTLIDRLSLDDDSTLRRSRFSGAVRHFLVRLLMDLESAFPVLDMG